MRQSLKHATWAVKASIVLAFAAISAAYAPIVVAAGVDQSRITTSFEVKHTEAILKRIAKLFSGGFQKGDAERLSAEIHGMHSDQPREWTFSVVYQGQTYQLQVRALLDDLGMVDLDFATDKALAPEVRTAVDGYLNARNL